MPGVSQALLTPAQVRKVAAADLSPVDSIILHINGVLGDPLKRKAATASVAVGGYYHVITDVNLTPQEALELARRCQEAKWGGGQVIVFEKRTAVCLYNCSSKGWESYYNGKPLVG